MKNRYGLEETLKNIFSLIYTKIFYKGAQLIRRPIYLRGRSFLEYGKGFTTGYNCRLEMFNTGIGEKKKLIIGENCKIGDSVHIAAGESVIIGDNCLFASKIYISDISHGDYSNTENSSNPNIPPDERPLYTNPVIIGNNVWIGENVCILPGVKIGNGCIIGGNSVVNKSIPDNCIAVGGPAKVVKIYNRNKRIWERVNDSTIRKLELY
jgi:acetyltransferase-like isoleucine patch superfamily enzyme